MTKTIKSLHWKLVNIYEIFEDLNHAKGLSNKTCFYTLYAKWYAFPTRCYKLYINAYKLTLTYLRTKIWSYVQIIQFSVYIQNYVIMNKRTSILRVSLRQYKFPTNTLRPFCRWHFQMHFLNKSYFISIKISLKFVPKGWTDNKSALVQVMACCQIRSKPLPEPMLTKISDAILHQ